MHAKSLQPCPTLCDPRLSPTRLLCPWDSPGKNTGVGCPALFHRLFPTQSGVSAIEPASLTSPCRWQAGSVPTVPPKKPLFDIFTHLLNSRVCWLVPFLSQFVLLKCSTIPWYSFILKIKDWADPQAHVKQASFLAWGHSRRGSTLGL